MLNRFETTLPADVRITSVKPRLDRVLGIVLQINVVARGVDDVKDFIANLEATGAFANVRPAAEQVNEAGLLESLLETAYTPGGKKMAAGRGAEGRR